MEVTVKYFGLADRQLKIKEQEAKGFRMVTDIFDDPEWKHGDPIIGTMTFTDALLPSLPEPLPPRDLAKEIDDLKAKVQKLEMR